MRGPSADDALKACEHASICINTFLLLGLTTGTALLKTQCLSQLLLFYGCVVLLECGYWEPILTRQYGYNEVIVQEGDLDQFNYFQVSHFC